LVLEVTPACGGVAGTATLELVSFLSEVSVIAVRVLGPMEVTVSGVPVGVGGPRQRCVLARLITARGQVVSVDRIIEDLYPGGAPPGAQAAVQSYVSRLRRALEPGRAAWAHAVVLVTSPPGYAARLGNGAVDAWSFEDEVRRAAELDDPAAVHARLSGALALWRGTAFEEFCGQAWADLEASRLAELRLTAIEARADAALRLGWAAPTVADLERLTAEQPLREEGWRLLALALYQTGRQADALAALRQVRELLAAELGVDPGPALRGMEQDILAHEPRLSVPANGFGLPVRDVPVLSELYAGRDAEVLRHRIAGLPDAARALLRLASVIGAESDVNVLREITGVEESDLLDAIDAALHLGLVTEPTQGRIRFTHAVVRDVLYGGLSRLRRARLHSQAAAAIERHNPNDVSALAHHFTEAGTDPARAARYCGLAAEQAERRFAFHEAARLREQALELLDQAASPERQEHGSDARERLELVLGLIRALSHDGQLAIAHPLRHEAMRAALRLNDAELLAQAVTALDVLRVPFFREYGEIDLQLVGVAERLLRELPPGDHPLRCKLLTTLAIELENVESERGRDASAEAVAMAGRLSDPVLLAMALLGRWTQSFHSSDPDERLRIGGELLTVSGKPATGEAAAQAMLMSASCGIADFRAADWHAAEAARIAARYRLPTIEAATGMYRAMRTALNGDPAAAAERYRGVARQLSGFGLRVHAAAVDAVATSALLITQGRTAEIAEEPYLADLFPELFALGLAAAGHTAAARSAAGPMLPVIRDRMWLFLTGVRGLLGIAADDRERARSAYQALLPHAAQPAGAETLLITLWPVALILGDLARYLGLPGAGAHYRDALAISERAGVRPWRDAVTSRLRLRALQVSGKSAVSQPGQPGDMTTNGPHHGH
jgi:DNA-binding SARP family transcriptional activator